jgi:hypothetical protein
VALGAIALGAFGAYLVNWSGEVDQSDPGWPEAAWLIGPPLAAGASVAIGILLMLVAALRLIDVALSRAAKATGIGCIGAPFVYLLCVLALLYLVDSFHVDSGWLPPMLIFALPLVVGIATVLGYVWLNDPPSEKA